MIFLIYVFFQIHLGSRTTYSNFPGRFDPLGIPYCTDFSLNSGYLTVGDDKGHALLYRSVCRGGRGGGREWSEANFLSLTLFVDPLTIVLYLLKACDLYLKTLYYR